ncbi:MAG: hypothetical protein HY329_21705 [Chloroflexi bacterium]|nr:hypothetical protein [Chloroflexota bacterium]
MSQYEPNHDYWARERAQELRRAADHDRLLRYGAESIAEERAHLMRHESLDVLWAWFRRLFSSRRLHPAG